MVAVIAYTGYDMEDAMIISKGSFQRVRGTFHPNSSSALLCTLDASRFQSMISHEARQMCIIERPLNRWTLMHD